MLYIHFITKTDMRKGKISKIPKEKDTIRRYRLFLLDPRRIELLFPGCKPGALPLSYGPPYAYWWAVEESNL